MDPSFASARHVDALTDVALDGLPMTGVDRIEDQLIAETARVTPPVSARSPAAACGHHCNHIWSSDSCHWCGFEEVES